MKMSKHTINFFFSVIVLAHILVKTFRNSSLKLNKQSQHLVKLRQNLAEQSKKLAKLSQTLAKLSHW